MNLFLQYLVFRGIAAFLQLLPLAAVRRCAQYFALFLFYVFPIRKKLTLDQLRHAFPGKAGKEIHAIARESYINLVTSVFELMWTPHLTDERISSLIHIHNPEVFHNALLRGKGVILMSGHFGNWEWLSIGAAKLLGVPFTVIVHPLHNARVDALVEGWRESLGNHTVPMGISIREIISTLHNKGVVAMLADQSGPSSAHYVSFFDRPAATYEGPATFALKTGAPIIMGFGVRRDDGGYDIEISEVESQDLSGTSEEQNVELTRRHVKVLEDLVRAHPGLWLWQHKRWKHSPMRGIDEKHG